MSTAVADPVDDVDEPRRVQVFLGDQLILDHIATSPSKGEWFEGAMRRRYACCRVTNTPYAEDSPAGGQLTP